MSTKERYGSAVWRAKVELESVGGVGENLWHSAGEVARKAGVSRNTARRYLDELVSLNRMVYIATPNGKIYSLYLAS